VIVIFRKRVTPLSFTVTAARRRAASPHTVDAVSDPPTGKVSHAPIARASPAVRAGPLVSGMSAPAVLGGMAGAGAAAVAVVVGGGTDGVIGPVLAGIGLPLAALLGAPYVLHLLVRRRP